MPRIVISESENHDAVAGELVGDYLELTTLGMQGGHIIVLGRLDFVAVYSQHMKNAPHVPETRAELQRALADNKQLSEHLKHVQERCTERLEETRVLQARIKELEASQHPAAVPLGADD